ncbi:cyclase family protein [Parageobacillus thermoglucosidasius]|jgi:kynurenine formamidase|uniref:Arylformamidase n=1 Tax=Parageobacillus thermoglucosidasius TaxID=1426 RepID=A0A1B7KNG7_PARTM|nr:cyclase family protein [Parageobacillus thermoglucosidasius]OAT71529.1 arylformamidase [Parageobacillus thermoglucosidasius]
MNIKKIVDLSMPITAQTPVYPGDPKPHIEPAATFAQNGYHVSRLVLGSHTGTHVDAPFHFREDGLRIDEVPLTYFLGKGIVIDVTGKNDGEAITLSDVKHYLPQLEPGMIALFHTGWSQYAGTERYFRHPYIAIDVIRAMLEQGIRTFFIDALNIDPPDGSSFPAHEAITAANGVIGENFTNFDKIDFTDPYIIALPLYLPGCDGSPVRAVAAELDL